MAGVLAIGVAACGDDVQIVEPTPPVAPPPPAVTASMAPASASVLIGNSVVFAVNASGGVAGDAASWTCASSNSGIASVSVVSAGCQATGVAAGSVTITATVTKSGETVNVGAQLTVTEEATGEPAFLIIKGVMGENSTDASGLQGRVNVNLGVERGDQTLERLSVLVDGEVAAYQSFGGSMDDGMGMAAPEDDAAAEQAVYDFTLSFDSDGYVEHGDHADVDYMNGEYSISAELQIASGMMADGMMGHQTVSSNVLAVVFDNNDGFVVTADLGDNSALDDDGRRWYGGPDNGHIAISALPVSYSGAEMGAVSVSLAGCTAGEADGDDHGNGGDDPHGDAEVSVEFTCTGAQAGRAIKVTVGGDEDGNILNTDDLPTANIDMEAPTNAPIIVANRNGRENGWINAAVGISGKFGSGSASDNWLVAGADTTGGVGGYNMGVRIGEDLEEAVGDAAASSLPADSDDNDSYCAVAVAMDDLGNMTELPDADGDCREAPTGTDVMVLLRENADADTTIAYGFDSTPADSTDADGVSWSNGTLEFGVDTTAPIIELGDDEYEMRFDETTAAAELATGGIAFEPADDESNVGNSGLHTEDGLMLKAERRSATGTQCVTVAADGTVAADAARNTRCTYRAAETITTAVTVAARTGEEAYWTVSGQAKDQAGNSSTVASHTFVYDNVIARATDPAAPGVVTAGEPFQGATYLNDGLSIRDYYGTMNYGDPAATGLSFGIGAPQAVDAFNAATLTNVNHAVTSQVGIVTTAGVGDPYAATQATVAADAAAAVDALQPISGVSIGVRDQAGAYAVQSTDILDANVTGQVADTLGFRADRDRFADTNFAFVFPVTDATATPPTRATTYTVCGYAKCTGGNAAPESTVKIEVVATAAATGTFRDPFERVDFWMTDASGVAWLVGSDGSGTGGRTDARNRTWSYSVTLPGTLLRAATRPDTAATNDADIGKIVAIGVSDRGVGLVRVMAETMAFGTEDTSDD